MQHFPIFVNLAGRRVVLAGGGEAALAKLRLLLKTEAHLSVFSTAPDPQIEIWAREGKLALHTRDMAPGDALCAVLAYAADEDPQRDARTAALARADGAMVNIVDNLEDSAFITPAIVDRDPVCVAIGTEGAAPVLARAIKRDLEEKLPRGLGPLARIGKAFRRAADALPQGRQRRDFWSDWYFSTGPKALDAGGKAEAQSALRSLLDRHVHQQARSGAVAIVGAGPGDPELLTLKARRLLHEADVVIHDRLVTPDILELARREAVLIAVGKEGFGPSTPQEEINALLIDHAQQGAQVVRLKSGDAGIFGRLDEEADALDAQAIPFTVVPGITAASGAAAAIGQSLTARGRNSELRILTAHDTRGFAEHDWRGLARPGAVAAIYMGKRGARFVQGRLLMHGAAKDMPITIARNVSRTDQQLQGTTLEALPDAVSEGAAGPAVILLGLAPRAATQAAIHAAVQDAAQLPSSVRSETA